MVAIVNCHRLKTRVQLRETHSPRVKHVWRVIQVAHSTRVKNAWYVTQVHSNWISGATSLQTQLTGYHLSRLEQLSKSSPFKQKDLDAATQVNLPLSAILPIQSLTTKSPPTLNTLRTQSPSPKAPSPPNNQIRRCETRRRRSTTVMTSTQTTFEGELNPTSTPAQCHHRLELNF